MSFCKRAHWLSALVLTEVTYGGGEGADSVVLGVCRVWLNLELVKKPAVCLEYILVHEMVHLLERHHNDRFREYMDQFMPQWSLHRDELNRTPRAHDEWGY